MKVEFIPATHSYFVDDVLVPSVTQILRPLMAHMPDCPEAMGRGTRAHAALHLYDEDKLDMSTVDADIQPFVNAYMAFKADSGVVIAASEKIVTSRIGYAGTLDRIVFLNGHMAVLDIKCGEQLPSWVGLQLAGYQIAASECGVPTSKRFGLLLRPNGEYKLREFNDALDHDRFLAMLQTECCGKGCACQ